jgi:protoheme IX farnesyltransferase
MRENVGTTAIDVRKIASHRATSWREWADLIFQLGKMKISLLATLSAASGYLLATARIAADMLVPTTAVFFLACGSCALNQYQERKVDRLMVRTRSRPIPSGRLSPETALSISLGLILSGFVILLSGANMTALCLGLFAVAWYNGVYIYLKKRTAFAVIPGALIGAIPPALGWVSGGGSLLDPRIWAVALFFFIWQVPHFWLLLVDFSRDYESAGLPVITKTFSTRQIKRILFIWLLSTGVSSLVLSTFGYLYSFSWYAVLLTTASWLFWNVALFLGYPGKPVSFNTMFARLNSYVIVVISLLALGRLFGS